MFGHLCVVLDEFDDDEDDEELLPVEPVEPDTSSTFVCALVTGTFVVLARAGVVAALAIAAPPNPSPKAPDTTAAAISGFFIRMLHLLLSAHCCEHPARRVAASVIRQIETGANLWAPGRAPVKLASAFSQRTG